MNRPDIRRLPKRANPFEAQKSLLQSVQQASMRIENVPLAEALGRILAQDAISAVNIPEYDKTFIDGYAINTQDTRAASTGNSATFKIIGKLFPADYPTSIQVGHGEAVYVATGSHIPAGADATVKVEETRLNGDQIEVIREIEPAEGIIPLGDDLKKDAVVLRKGQVLRPQDLGLLASLELTQATVVKKPKIAIISGGDELIKQTQNAPTKIANNYALVVSGLAQELGAETRLVGIMPDALDKVQSQIHQALAESDVVVTIGGSSVGVKDFVPDAVNAFGSPGVVVQGVLLRPGAISGFGIVEGKPVVMLPGHIGSCIAGFYLFVAPLISYLLGLAGDGLLPRLTAELSEDLETGPQFRFQLTRVQRVNGKLLASPVEGGSSALTTISKSNGYTIILPHTKLLKGATVEVALFGKLELSQVTA